jgi:hypothetical protein
MATTQPSNLTPDLIAEHYAGCRQLLAAAEEAQEEAKKLMGRYRASLKSAKKAGIPSDDLAWALQNRMQDPDELAMEFRNRLLIARVMGIVSAELQETVIGLSFDPAEASMFDDNVIRATAVGRAEDEGLAAGLNGHGRADNPYDPMDVSKSELRAAWDRRWVEGERRLQGNLAESGSEAASSDRAPVAGGPANPPGRRAPRKMAAAPPGAPDHSGFPVVAAAPKKKAGRPRKAATH